MQIIDVLDYQHFCRNKVHVVSLWLFDMASTSCGVNNQVDAA